MVGFHFRMKFIDTKSNCRSFFYKNAISETTTTTSSSSSSTTKKTVLTGKHWFSFACFAHKTCQCNHNHYENEPEDFHFFGSKWIFDYTKIFFIFFIFLALFSLGGVFFCNIKNGIRLDHVSFYKHIQLKLSWKWTIQMISLKKKFILSHFEW